MAKSTLHIPPEKARTYSEALSDFLCWAAGFTAAGGDIGPVNLRDLRELNIEIKALDMGFREQED